jgi:hypothetical protein
VYRAVRYGKDEKVKDTGSVPNVALSSAICHCSKLNNVVGSVILESGPSRKLVNLSLVWVIGNYDAQTIYSVIFYLSGFGENSKTFLVHKDHVTRCNWETYLRLHKF